MSPIRRYDTAAAARAFCPANACAVVLAGGRGTRISHLYPDTPKPFIQAAGLPFIAWVLRQLALQGMRRAIVSLGHLADEGRRSLAKCAQPGLRIDTVVERQPLGTAGGMLLAADAVPDADPIVLLNGDSLVVTDFAPVWEQLARDDCDGVLIGLQMEDAARYGRLDVSTAGELIGFREKQPGAGLINAGVYVLRRRLLRAAPRGVSLSMETEWIPALLRAGARLRVHPVAAPFLDIGTPETVHAASEFIGRHYLQEARP